MLTKDRVSIAESGMLRIRVLRLKWCMGSRGEARWSQRAALSQRSSGLIGTGSTRQSAFRIPQSGFTLVELLAVIAIIGILSAITFGLARAVTVRSNIGKTKVEIAGIAQGLEAYRVKYGDYPQTGSAAVMLQSLIGKKGPKGATVTDKPLIELGRYSTVNDLDPVTSASAQLMDPFGKPYYYSYKTGASWKNPSFVLYSGGPDGAVQGTFPTDGYLTSSFETSMNGSTGTGNPDNIYFGRN